MNLSAMAPNHHFMLNGLPMEPVSRTYQYRKIMKPMLERKRRARINKCLDELKDLMTGTLQADGENVSKLEKADILELTVRHLHRLREHNSLFLQANMIGGNTNNNNNVLNTEKFWAGFQHCAAEVLQFLSRYDRTISGELIQHIASYIPGLPVAAPQSTVTAPPTLSPPPPPPTTATATTMKTATLHQRELATAMRPHLPARPADSAKVRIHPYARQRVENEEHVWRPW